MKTGIFGFPKVGKTTLFNLMTRQSASTDKFATGRSAANRGFATVADPRVEKLRQLFQPKKTTFAQVEFVDVAGIKKGELKDAVDLVDLRPVDALVHVVRAFDDPEIEHAPGAINPARDIQAMEEELLLADLITVERRLERVALDMKKRKDADLPKEHAALERLHAVLEASEPVRTADLSDEEHKILRGFQFLSAKPILHVLNLGEERQDLRDDVVAGFGLEAVAKRPQTAVSYVLGQLEMEISQLDPADAKAFLEDLGVTESGLDRIIRTSYELLGLMSFFTVGEDEVRAWTIPLGTSAHRAAGAIHSDIERGFIRAEVMRHEDLLAKGSEKAVKDAGLFRLEGKTYTMQDGDVAHFRFAV